MITFIHYGKIQMNSEDENEIIALDEDDLVAITTREIAENHKLFSGERLVDCATKNIPSTNNIAFTSILTNELMYSFSKKREIIQLNPQMKDFVLRHEELNYYELAKFLDKVNSKDKIESIVKDNKYKKRDLLETYRQLLYDEFETEHINNDYILSDVNTIELLIEAEKRYSQSNITEMENAYYKEFFKKEETINNNSEDMKLYLDDPERVINMIKVRHRINC